VGLLKIFCHTYSVLLFTFLFLLSWKNRMNQQFALGTFHSPVCDQQYFFNASLLYIHLFNKGGVAMQWQG